MSLTSQVAALATRISAEVKSLWTRTSVAPYVIYINTSTRVFPAIPNPRPAPVITFNATKLDDFDPETEMPTLISHPLLAAGDIVEFYYEAA